MEPLGYEQISITQFTKSCVSIIFQRSILLDPLNHNLIILASLALSATFRMIINFGISLNQLSYLFILALYLSKQI